MTDITANAAATEGDARPDRATLLVYFSALIAMFMASMDMQIVVTALPTIAAELGNQHLFGWVGSAYLLSTAAVSSAEPLRWGWTLTSSAGEVLGSASGLEVTDVNFGLLPAPVLPPGPATPQDPSSVPNVHVKSATSTAKLTLTDEVTNTSSTFDLTWTKFESWLLVTNPDGSTSADVQDSWDESGPRNPAAPRRVGGLTARVEQMDAVTLISVAPADVPEPGASCSGALDAPGQR